MFLLCSQVYGSQRLPIQFPNATSVHNGAHNPNPMQNYHPLSLSIFQCFKQPYREDKQEVPFPLSFQSY